VLQPLSGDDLWRGYGSRLACTVLLIPAALRRLTGLDRGVRYGRG
jgi:hypothetical protein